MSGNDQATWIATSSGSVLQPLDIAFEYVRDCGLRHLPGYVLAMAPMSAAVYFLIDLISSQHRRALPFWCLVLTGATVWRWIGIAYVQCRVQYDLRGETRRFPLSKIPSLILARLLACFAFTWGSFLVFPAFCGFFLSGFATLVVFERENDFFSQTGKALGMIQRRWKRLSHVGLALSLGAFLVFLALTVLYFMLAFSSLPEFLGLDTGNLEITVKSGACILSLIYLYFLVFDFYWTFAAVTVFYDVQAMELGTDLRQRLVLLQEKS
jgi:hypothetical protein